MAVTHFAFELGARHEGSDRIDDQHVNGARADQSVRYLERLFAGVGLGNQQIVDIDAELAGIGRVERVLGVYESAGAAAALRFGNDMQGKRRLAGALRPVNLNDPATRQPTDAERDIETQRSRRDHLGIRGGLARPKLHYRTLAEGAFDLSERRVQSPLLVHCFLVQEAQCRLHCPVLLIPYPMMPCNAAGKPRVHFLFARCNAEGHALRDPHGEDVSHLGRELLQAERLGQKLDTAVAVEPLTERVLGIPRNEYHLHVRVDLPHFADEPGPVHMRHDNIGDQQIDRFFGIADQIESRFATLRLYYLVAFVAQRAGAEDPDRIVILDEHDGAVPGQILYRDDFGDIGSSGRHRIRRLAARQVNLEDRALPGRAAYENETACLLDDAVDRRQAETGSGAEFFGRKEGVENASPVRLGDADAGIRHLDQYIVASRHHLVTASQFTFLMDVCRANGQRAAAWHRVAGIDGEIDDDLFELALVNLHKAETAPVHDLEVDVFADEPLDQMAQLVENVGDIEHPRLQGLLS